MIARNTHMFCVRMMTSQLLHAARQCVGGQQLIGRYGEVAPHRLTSPVGNSLKYIKEQETWSHPFALSTGKHFSTAAETVPNAAGTTAASTAAASNKAVNHGLGGVGSGAGSTWRGLNTSWIPAPNAVLKEIGDAVVPYIKFFAGCGILYEISIYASQPNFTHLESSIGNLETRMGIVENKMDDLETQMDKIEGVQAQHSIKLMELDHSIKASQVAVERKIEASQLRTMEKVAWAGIVVLLNVASIIAMNYLTVSR